MARGDRVISLPPIVSPRWLTDGLERVALKNGPPSGIEFDDLTLSADKDPVQQLAGVADTSGDRSHLRDAVAGALHYYEATAGDPQLTTRVLDFLLQLGAIFASEEAARAVMQRLEAGAYDRAEQDLDDALLQFVARQPRGLRARFEGRLRALRGSLHWQPSWAIPLIERDLAEEPRHWLQTLSLRLADLRAETQQGFNPAQLLMRTVARRDDVDHVIEGLTYGEPERDEGVLDLLLDQSPPDFRLQRTAHVLVDAKRREKNDFRGTEDFVFNIRLGWLQPWVLSIDDFMMLREGRAPSPFAMTHRDYERSETGQAWASLVRKRAEPVRQQAEIHR